MVSRSCVPICYSLSCCSPLAPTRCEQSNSEAARQVCQVNIAVAHWQAATSRSARSISSGAQLRIGQLPTLNNPHCSSANQQNEFSNPRGAIADSPHNNRMSWRLQAAVCAVPLVGICNGGIWTLLPLIMADLFGLENLGANYKIACFGEAVGYLLVSRGLAARLYEDAIAAGHGGGGGEGSSDGGGPVAETTCIGPECFREVHIVCAGLCAIAVFAGLLLGKRTGQRAGSGGGFGE